MDVVTHQDMFVELGQALMKRELWDKALDCFASINEEDAVSYPLCVQSDDRSRMNLPISLRLESVYIILEDRKRPWSISDGVSLGRERGADCSGCGRS